MSGLISFGFIIAMTPWRAFVLFKLWLWFLVPVWPMLAAPKWNLYGLSIIVTFLTASTKKDEAKVDWIYAAVAAFIGPAAVLLLGWAIKVICL
jgi:hypothetical protein